MKKHVTVEQLNDLSKDMKYEYEICKGIKDEDGDIVWSAIAWSDVRTYADDILYALNVAYNDKFAILHNGKIIK